MGICLPQLYASLPICKIESSLSDQLHQFFSIAHELRHIWQIQNDEELYFSTYKPIDLFSSVEEYNLQIAELDANAFAGLIMIDFFHLKPLFEGVPDSVMVLFSKSNCTSIFLTRSP